MSLNLYSTGAMAPYEPATNKAAKIFESDKIFTALEAPKHESPKCRKLGHAEGTWAADGKTYVGQKGTGGQNHSAYAPDQEELSSLGIFLSCGGALYRTYVLHPFHSFLSEGIPGAIKYMATRSETYVLHPLRSLTKKGIPSASRPFDFFRHMPGKSVWAWLRGRWSWHGLQAAAPREVTLAVLFLYIFCRKMPKHPVDPEEHPSAASPPANARRKETVKHSRRQRRSRQRSKRAARKTQPRNDFRTVPAKDEPDNCTEKSAPETIDLTGDVTFDVCIKYYNKPIIIIECEQSDNAHSIRSKWMDAIKIPPQKQTELHREFRVLFQGKDLAETTTVAELGLGGGDTLHLVTRGLGGRRIRVFLKRGIDDSKCWQQKNSALRLLVQNDGDSGYTSVAYHIMNQSNDRRQSAFSKLGASIRTGNPELTGCSLRKVLANLNDSNDDYWKLVNSLGQREVDAAIARASIGKSKPDGWAKYTEIEMLSLLFDIPISLYHKNPTNENERWRLFSEWLYDERQECSYVMYDENHFDALTEVNLEEFEDDQLRLIYPPPAHVSDPLPSISTRGCLHPGTASQFSLSAEEVDSTLSQLKSPLEIKIVKWLWGQLSIENDKAVHIKHAKYASRKMKVRRKKGEENSTIENILFGLTQAGKSSEAAKCAWDSVFVLGCLPVLFVRNSGGLYAGKKDMIEAIEVLNGEIKKLLKAKFPAFTEEDIKRFQLDVKTDEKKIDLATKGPIRFAIVALNNASHIKRMFYSHNRSNKKVFPGRIISTWFSHRNGTGVSNDDNTCIFRCRDGEEYELTKSDIRPTGAEFEAGQNAKFYIKDKERKDPILHQLNGKGQKYDGVEHKRRFILIMDEADMSAASPGRNANKGERLTWHGRLEESSSSEEERSSSESEDISVETIRKSGIGAHVFAVMFITATPGALCVNSIEGVQPHIIVMDVPMNYAAYKAQIDSSSAHPSQPFIIRNIVTFRENTENETLTETYRRVVLENEWCSPRVWDNMIAHVKEVGNRLDVGETIDESILYDFKVQRSSNGTISIKAPPKRTLEHRPHQCKLHDKVKSINMNIRNGNREKRGWRIDFDGVTEMIDDMLRGTPGKSNDQYRQALIITNKTISPITNQESMQEAIRERYRGEDIVCITLNHKGQRVYVCNDMHYSMMKQCLIASTDEQIDVVVGGGFKLSKRQNIKATLTAVKNAGVKNVVVISGSMGGRGQSYHTEDHSRILTDMFVAFDIPENRDIRVHGEMWMQIFGRLNTLVSEGLHCPRITLWANKAVHELHEDWLNMQRDDMRTTAAEGSYNSALKKGKNVILAINKKTSEPVLAKRTRKKLDNDAVKKRENCVQHLLTTPRHKPSTLLTKSDACIDLRRAAHESNMRMQREKESLDRETEILEPFVRDHFPVAGTLWKQLGFMYGDMLPTTRDKEPEKKTIIQKLKTMRRGLSQYVSRDAWTTDELELLADMYLPIRETGNSESNNLIHKLAFILGRQVRATERQIACFTAIKEFLRSNSESLSSKIKLSQNPSQEAIEIVKKRERCCWAYIRFEDSPLYHIAEAGLRQRKGLRPPENTVAGPSSVLDDCESTSVAETMLSINASRDSSGSVQDKITPKKIYRRKRKRKQKPISANIRHETIVKEEAGVKSEVPRSAILPRSPEATRNGASTSSFVPFDCNRDTKKTKTDIQKLVEEGYELVSNVWSANDSSDSNSDFC